MIDKIKNCVVQISDDKRFSGTGFFISYKGYIITCHHVIYSLKEIWIRYRDGDKVQATWCKKYSNIDADIAVLKIDESIFTDIEIVKIVNPLNFSSQKALLYGFPSKKREQNPRGFSYDSVSIRYSEDVSLKSFFKSNKLNSSPWSKLPSETATYSSIRIDNIEVDSGVSGGLVYVEELDGVVGMIQAKDSKENYTNAIRWENFFHILSPKDIEDMGLRPINNELKKLDTSLLKQALLIKNYPNESLQKLAYSTLPKESNRILSDSINEIIDELSLIEDFENSQNIPILCFAKRIYKRESDSDILKWIKYAKSYFKIDELKCEKRELNSEYNILIEISITNRDITKGNIKIWENRVLTKGCEKYKSTDIDDSINLKDDNEIKSFVDKLFNYLKKFNNPEKVLLEFILPRQLLNTDIKLWKNSTERRIHQEYPTIFRFQERFVNYADFKDKWEFHWRETYKKNKTLSLKVNSSCLKVLEDGEKIDRYTRKENACITTKFPLSDMNGSYIYSNGISIVLSPRTFKTDEELEEFNCWFEDNFKKTSIENIVDEVNRLFARNHKEFKSNIILIWDNPNRVPEKYKKVELYEFDF